MLEQREFEEAQKEARRRDRQMARQDREQDAYYKQLQRSNANAESEEIHQFVEDLKNLHLRFVNDCTPLDFPALLRKQRPAEFVPEEVDELCMLPAKYYDGSSTAHPEDHRIFECTLEDYLRYIPPPTLWERMSGSGRFEAERSQAEELYQRRRREVRADRERAWTRWNEEARQAHEAQEEKKKRRREWLVKVRDGYARREVWGTSRYFERKLRSVALPKGLEVEYGVTYQPDARRATILVAMPDDSIVPRKAAVRYVAEHNEFRESKRPESEAWRIYQAAAAGLLVGVVHCVFQCDAERHLDTVIARVNMPGHAPATGAATRLGLITLLAGREDWAGLDPAHLKPVDCLRTLGALFEEGWKRS